MEVVTGEMGFTFYLQLYLRFFLKTVPFLKLLDFQKIQFLHLFHVNIHEIYSHFDAGF